MRVCLVYDCLFPHTIGGAERWYRSLAERLSREGHQVTYLTLRQWGPGERPDLPGCTVVEAGPKLALYGPGGQRRILPPLIFGLGVFWHLLRHGRRYDAVHTASFPYFSVLAAALCRPLHGYRLVVDWHELWSRRYWLDYLGPVLGWGGIAVQQLCVRIPQRAFCFARLTADRLRAAGLNGPVTVLEGEYAGPLEGCEPRHAEPVVVFAGRHIPEKRAPAVVAAVAEARRRTPDLRGVVFGDGPQRDLVLSAIERLGLAGVVEAPGFVAGAELKDRLSRALCLVHPSSREGYGLVVIESAAMGTPVVLVQGEDNAAVELIEEGVNGFVAPSASAEDLAGAIGRVREGGHALRLSTAEWFVRNAGRLSIDSSLNHVARAYEG